MCVSQSVCQKKIDVVLLQPALLYTYEWVNTHVA